jgi:hypothetical protein
MYCVRVSPGTEKKQVSKIADGFLPMYQSVNEYGRSGKYPVVPGYVFTQNYVPGTVQVPDDEWKIIEAISDPQPSVLDHANRMITEGPLRVIEGEITDIEAERISVCVRLLGDNRQYWLVVTPFDPETAETYRKPIPEEPEEDEKEGEKDMGEKMKVEYTAEQEAEMIARAEKVGIQQAAKEYSVSWQVIAGMKRRARGKKPEAEGAEGKKAEPVKKAEKKKKKETSAARMTAPEESDDELPAAPEDAEGLRIQNAVLREKAEKLEAQVARLKKALQVML